jgi:type VI protein secretion system component Hcp
MAKASLYLKLVDRNDKLVRGECYDDKHLDQIQLTGWNWAVQDPAVVPKDDAKAAGAETAKAKAKAGTQGDTGDNIKPGHFGISKQTDRSTVRLISAVDNGEVFPTATFFLEEEYEASTEPFKLEIVLTDVFFVDVDWTATAGSAGMEFNETWNLNYKNIKFSYQLRGSRSLGQEFRGRRAGWIDVDFDRPPDAAEGASAKSPLSAAENKEAFDKRVNDAVSARLKKTGK